MKKLNVSILFFLAASLWQPHAAAQVILPFNFSPSTPIQSSQVNANFGAVASEINSHENAVNPHQTTLAQILLLGNSCGATSINFNGTQGLDFLAENLASDPSPGTAGRFFINTTTHLLKFDDGTTIQTIGGSGANNLASVLNSGNSAGAFDIDMNQHQLLNARIENRVADPSAGNAGRLIYNTTTHDLKVDSGAVWTALGGSQGLSSVLMVSNSAGSTNIDFNSNQAKNMVLDSVASDPGSPVSGQIWYNTTSHVPKFYNGTSYLAVGNTNTLAQTMVLGNSVGANPIDFNSHQALNMVLFNNNGSPGTGTGGFVWFDTGDSQIHFETSGANHTLASTDQVQTLTNKTISGLSNTITNVQDGSLSANVDLLNAAQVITGIKNFTTDPKMGHITSTSGATMTIPVGVASDTFVLLNAVQNMAGKSLIAPTFTSNTDFSEGQAIHFRVENLASDPVAGNAGRIYYKTTTGELKYDTGSATRVLTFGNPTLADVLNNGNSAGAMDLDMNLNQLLNVRVENLLATPAAGNAGRLIFNTTLGQLLVDDGATWNTAGGGGGGVTIYPNFGAFPGAAPNGTLAVDASADLLYMYSTGAVAWQGTSSNTSYVNALAAATSVGALDAQAPNANGLDLTANVLSAQSADATHPGMVNNTTQTFSGDKTFTGITSGQQYIAAGGTPVAPAFAVSETGNDTGMYSVSDGVLNWSNNASLGMTLDASHNLLVAGTITASNFPIVGGANTPAYFDVSGNLNSIPGWSLAPQFGAYGESSQQTYTIPVDGTGGVKKIYDFETEFDAANSNTDQSLYQFAIDSHVDRNHSGGNVASANGFSISASVEGSGTVGNHTAATINQNLSGNAGGTTTNAAGLALGAGAGPGYTVGSYRLIDASFNANATSIVGDLSSLNLLTSGPIGGNFSGLNLSHAGDIVGSATAAGLIINGNVGSSETMLNVGSNGTITGNFQGLNLTQNGDSGSLQFLNLNQIGGNTGNAEGVRIGLSNGTATGKTAIVAIMGDGSTSGAGRIIESTWGAGDYVSNRIGINIGGGSGNTPSDTVMNLTQSSGTTTNFQGVNVQGNGTATNWQGVSVGGGGTATNVTGMQINLGGMTSPNLKTGLSINDGTLNVQSTLDTSIVTPGFFFQQNSLGGQLIVANGHPVAGAPGWGNALSVQVGADDDYTADNTLGPGNSIGYSINAIVNQVNITATHTFDTLNYMLAGGSTPPGSDGTLVNLNMFRAAGLLPSGGTLAVTNAKGFEVDPAFDAMGATNEWGVWVGASNADNWFSKDVVIGGATGKPEAGQALDVTGAVRLRALTTAGCVTTDVSGHLSSGACTGGSGRSTAVVAIDTTVPTLTKDYLLNVDTTGGLINITLPDAVASDGWCIDVKDIATNTVHNITTGGQTIDGGASFDILDQNDANHFCAISGNWSIY